jgi:cellobiose-specific phosphotransferase system component IIC
MSELELFLLMGVLIPNFNTMDLVKIIEKNQKLHIHIVAVTLKVMSCRTMSKKKKWKKVKNQNFMGKTNYFLRTLPFSPSATWLHVGAPWKIQEKWA